MTRRLSTAGSIDGTARRIVGTAGLIVGTAGRIVGPLEGSAIPRYLVTFNNTTDCRMPSSLHSFFPCLAIKVDITLLHRESIVQTWPRGQSLFSVRPVKVTSFLCALFMLCCEPYLSVASGLTTIQFKVKSIMGRRDWASQSTAEPVC